MSDIMAYREVNKKCVGPNMEVDDMTMVNNWFVSSRPDIRDRDREAWVKMAMSKASISMSRVYARLSYGR